MNEVITRLNEIEEKAEAIIEDAKDRREQMQQQIVSDKVAIDLQYEKEEKKRIEELKKELDGEVDSQLREMQQKTQKAIDQLNLKFDQNQEALADEVFRRVITV